MEDLTAEVPAKPPYSLAREFKEMGAVIALLFGRWPVMNMVLGVTLVSFGNYGGGPERKEFLLELEHAETSARRRG